MKDTGTDLTAQQLNNIKGWFGDAVFTKNSSGLVVDHKRQYIQINIGGNVTVDGQGNVTLVEGNSASLNATRFSLAEDSSTNYIWAIGPVDGSTPSGRYMGLTVIQAEDTIDNIAYIQSTQSNFGINNPNDTGYDVKIYTSASGVPYNTTLHVLAASYPTDLFINHTPESTTLLKESPGYIEFPASGTAASFFVDSNQTYSATVRSVTYTLKRLDDNAEVSFTTGESGDQLESFQDPYIRISKSTSKNGIKIIADGAFPQSVKQYLLTASVLFASGYTMQCTKNILVQDDITAVVQSINTHMFDPINTAWQTQFGSAIGKNSLFKVDLFALTGTIDFSTSGANL